MNRSGYFFLMCLVLLCGCSNGYDAGKIYVPESGGHVDKWTNPDYIGTSDFHGYSVNINYSSPKGPSLYALRCYGCHGKDAGGYIGPNIQGRSVNNISNAMNTVRYMLWLGRLSTSDEIQAIADFLADTGMTSTYTVDADVCSSCHGDDFNGDIAKIGCYACHLGPDGTNGHPSGWTTVKSNSVRFHGYYALRSTTSCTACHGSDLRGPKVPSCYSCHGSCDSTNCPPVAYAGSDQSVVVSTTVTLDGTGSSDVNGDALTYNWSFTSKPVGSLASLSDSTASMPTFTADVAGNYAISLTVSDGKSGSEADYVAVTASSSVSAVSFSAGVQPVFNNNCISCHVSGGFAGFLILTSGVSYNNLVNQPSARTGNPPSGTRVVPYDSANSVLYQRISGIGLPAGESTMPLGGALLSDSDQSLIKTWIDQGASNN
ncbi:MAG: hypothetical protein HY754_12225 [Nitrospirae bacterium]|nr:hypothetical protein [Nitrospirota bacterium]